MNCRERCLRFCFIHRRRGSFPFISPFHNVIIRILVIADYIDVVARKAGAECGVGGVIGQASSNNRYPFLIVMGNCSFHSVPVGPYPTKSACGFNTRLVLFSVTILQLECPARNRKDSRRQVGANNHFVVVDNYVLAVIIKEDVLCFSHVSNSASPHSS